METKTTIRTIPPQIQLRNLRNRIAVLTMRKLFGGLNTQEAKELKELQIKLIELEKQSS